MEPYQEHPIMVHDIPPELAAKVAELYLSMPAGEAKKIQDLLVENHYQKRWLLPDAAAQLLP